MRALIVGIVCGGLAAALGCARSDPLEGFPKGAYLAGDGAAARRVLQRVAQRSATPLGRDAGALLRRIEECERVSAHAPEGGWAELLDELRCSPGLPALVATQIGDADLLLRLPFGQEGSLLGALRVGPRGSVKLDAELHPSEIDGMHRLVLPAETPAGPAVLNTDDTLVHARFRAAGGLNIARMVPTGGQGELLFRLKSDLFAGAVLDGSWELAIYLPERRGMPPVALALGHRLRAAARAAADQFVGELRSSWPISRQEIHLGDDAGACLADLKVLPDLAPCYVATERALVVGWNRASLEKGLASGTAAGPDQGGGIVVHLDRFDEADARLQRLTGLGDGSEALDYVWERLVAHTERRDGDVRLALQLVAEGGD